MNLLLPALIFVLINTAGIREENCKPCNTETLSVVRNSLDSLQPKMIANYLCTLDTSCRNNTEFSEWSNELIFLILSKNANLFFEVLDKQKDKEKFVLAILENPIHNLINLQVTYDRIKTSSASIEIKNKCLSAVKLAATKTGSKLKE